MSEAGLPEAPSSWSPPRPGRRRHMLNGLNGTVDVIVPRGGKTLVDRVQDEARVPVFAHLEGICHTYVDKAADPDMAVDVIINAKMRRTGVCGATECLLVHRDVVASHAPAIIEALQSRGCEVHADQAVSAVSASVVPASQRRLG